MGRSYRDAKIVPLYPEETSEYNAVAEQSANFIGRKIREARTSRKYSLMQFSEALQKYGVTVGDAALSKWEVGRSVPNAYQLLAIAHALGIAEDMSYFVPEQADLNTEGQVKLREYKADLIASGKYRPAPEGAQIRRVEMPVSCLPVSAGTGAFLDEDNFEKVSFPAAMVPGGAEFGVYVSGDSMEPVYHDGQIVWVHRCESLNPGDIGIFVYDGCGYIKSYGEQEPDDAYREEYTDSYGNLHRQPVLVSFNEAYRPIPVSPDAAFQVIGKVLR